MPKLKRLSGADVVKILESFGFVVVSQKGSHLKLARQGTLGREILVVPDHKELKTGTLKAIFNQATKYISTKELQGHFYNQ